MPVRKRFAGTIVKAVRDGKYFGIRAGERPHRFIGIWMVEVADLELSAKAT